MNDAAFEKWTEANQRYLHCALGEVRVWLERQLEGKPKDAAWERHAGAARAAAEKARKAMPAPAALDRLCDAFQLTRFERAILLACAGIELDASFAALAASAFGQSGRAALTFSLALAALPDPHWSALSPSAALREWQLIELSPGDSLVFSPLRIDERVLHFLTGVGCLDERLRGVACPIPRAPGMPASHEDLARRMAAVWAAAAGQREFPALVLCGTDTQAKRETASAAAEMAGGALMAIRASDLPLPPSERVLLARVWEREAVLSPGALLVEAEDPDPAEAARVAGFVESLRGLVLVACRDPLQLGRRSAVRFDIDKPERVEQRRLWAEVLGPVAGELDGRLDGLVSHFHFGPHAIRSASLAMAAGQGGSEERLWGACVAQSRPRLEGLAQRITAAAAWDDLVLPERQKTMLRAIATEVRQRPKVYGDWGFETKSARGLGISAMFAGPSGTGKTMAAEVLARELNLDLYRVDLSAVISKYIGETEKNLRRIFDAAEDGGAVLLFDEADALFGKRTEVRDSHDRYANIEVSYLLQRMEAHRGLAILTTNMKGSIDTAFLRRLRFIVDFPFPGLSERAAIWARIFPAATPLDGVDSARLARLNVSGGHIRNIALGAAFRAAEAGEPVRMRYLLEAARQEYAKLERPMLDSEIEGWV